MDRLFKNQIERFSCLICIIGRPIGPIKTTLFLYPVNGYDLLNVVLASFDSVGTQTDKYESSTSLPTVINILMIEYCGR